MSDVQDRIKSYLLTGGMFNPEMALHDRVRDLLIDCRDYIAELEEQNKWISVDERLPEEGNSVYFITAS